MQKDHCSNFLLFVILFFSQERYDIELRKTEELNNLIDTVPEKAFKKANLFLKEARKKNIHDLELSMLQIKCSYYEKKYDFKI
jgi:hypothetical protein